MADTPFTIDQLARRRESALAQLAADPFDPLALLALRPAGLARDAGGGTAEYADPNAGLAGFDGRTATAVFVISTPTRDRHGDWVVPEGCAGRLERYSKNPVVFFGHKSYGLPIGSARQGEGADAPLGVRVEAGKGLVSACRFHLKTRESEDVCRLVEAGELRASSIGFLPVKGRAVFPEEETPKARGDAAQKPVDFAPWVSFIFDEWELLEWSVVAVPANPDCVALRLSKGFDGKPLSDGVRRALEPFVSAPIAWAPGFGRVERQGQQKTQDSAPAIPPASDPPPALEGKKRLPHGALTLVRLVRRVGETIDWLCGEREVLDQPAVKAAAGTWEHQLGGLRDAAVTLALAEYPDIDFAAEHTAFAAQEQPLEQPAASPEAGGKAAGLTAVMAPVAAAAPPSPPAATSPVVVAAAGPDPGLGRLLAEIRAAKAEQDGLKAALRSVTGVLD